MAITNFAPGTFVWTDGAPTHNPDDGAKFAIDENTYVQYEWVSGTTWVESPISVKKISGTSAPTGAPGLHESQLAINEVAELYYYFSGSWHLVSGGGGGGSYTAGEGIDITAGEISLDTLDRVRFNQTPILAGGERVMRWNDTDGTLEFGMKGGNVTQQIGQELPILVKNADNAGLTNGTVVYTVGSDGVNKTVRLARADSETTSANTFGVMTESATGGNKAFCTTFGMVHNLDTSALTEGAMVWLSATTAGAMTTTRPTAPNHAVQIGFCIRSHATQGVIFVTVQNGYELGELHNVAITSPAAGNVLAYNSGTGAWVNTPGVLASTTAGGDISGTFSNLQIVANAVGTNEIADDAVTAAKIAANAVGSSELQSTSVTPGSYTYASLTVDADGRLTAASSGTTPLTAVTTDTSLTGDGSGGSPLGISFPIKAPDGNVSAPSYTFNNRQVSGLFNDDGIAIKLKSEANQGLTLLTEDYASGDAGGVSIVTGAGSNVAGPVSITTGAGDGGNGGDVSITTGTGNVGRGGNMTITLGNSTSGEGGNFSLQAGTSDATNSGNVTMLAGSGTRFGGYFLLEAGDGGEEDGGNFTLNAGASSDATGGAFNASAGESTFGDGGYFNMQAGAGSLSGGYFTMRSGDASGSGASAGNFTMSAGNNASGNGGGFTMSSGSGLYGGNFAISAGSTSADEETGATFSMTGGESSGTDAAGGNFVARGGLGSGTDNAGGQAILIGGNGTFVGGAATAIGGNGTSGNANGGDVYFQGGTPSGSGRKGIVYINNSVFRLAIFTTTQRDALIGVTSGAMIFNSTTSKFQGYDGSAWVDFH